MSKRNSNTIVWFRDLAAERKFAETTIHSYNNVVTIIKGFISFNQ